MRTADGEIRAFLSGDVDDSRRLDIAMLFAQSMLQELRAAVAEWEATSAMLQEARASRQRRSVAAPPAFANAGRRPHAG